MYRNKYRIIIPFLAPSLILYFTFVLYPYASAMYISLTRWPDSPSRRSSLAWRTTRMLKDDNFWNALGNNAFYIIVLPVVTLGVALFFAFVLTQGARFAKFYRVSYFFPQVMSVVAIGVLWSFVYHPIIGILNSILRAVGVENPPVWLGDPNLVLPAIGTVTIWQAIGFFMVLFIAAMESVPDSYYEAARLDGATQWDIFWKITIPLIWDTLQTAVIFIMISATDMFAITQTMTNGGPARSSEVLSTFLYNEAFLGSKFGYGTAIAVTLFILVLFITVVLARLMGRDSLEY